MNYNHDKIKPFAKEDSSKKEQVAKMFDQIAFRYDFLNHFLTAGIDVGWRKKAIKQIKDYHPQKILDVATGTADVALLTYKMLQPKQIIGIDISTGMLELGRKKIAEKGWQNYIELQTGDSESINFADSTFDAITVAFGVRNFANLEKGLNEMLRVLKPTGKLAILEFSRPKSGFIRFFYNLYSRSISPRAGKLIANNKEAYEYLNNSIEAFPEGDAFLEIMRNVGYKNIYCKPLTFGVCSIYGGSK